jgi:hypothetical protein
VLGTIVQTGLIRPVFRHSDYYPPVSQALEAIFPLTQRVQGRCTLEPKPPDDAPPVADNGDRLPAVIEPPDLI